MKVAATEQQKLDLLSAAGVMDKATGTVRKPEAIQAMRDKIERDQQGARDGTLQVPTMHTGRMNVISKVATGAAAHKKHMLMKRSKKCGQTRRRYFDIDGGRLNVYKYDTKNVRATHVYELARIEDKPK